MISSITTMDSIRTGVLSLQNHIRTKSPILKRRTPLWFFEQEFRNKNNCGGDGVSNVKRNQIWECWRRMNPESKRCYFNMAELDKVRFKEEQADRIAKISSLMRGDQSNSENYIEDNETAQMDKKFSYLLKYQRNYERLVQIKTTRELYKKVIQNLKGDRSDLQADNELVNEVPEEYRTVLSLPKRPPPPFILFTCDEKERIMNLRKESQIKSSFFKTAGAEWAKTSPEKREIYEEKYRNLVNEYNKAMLKFKKENMLEDSYLGQASKERKALKRSLRKRLRDHDIIPLSVRNAFNFFLMDHKDVPLIDLTKIWRELPEEEKDKYRKLNREDLLRYQRQKSSFDNFLKQVKADEII